ncbi:hypothetical protein BH20ACT5_BH20ACT5_13570 [soil metagenome]
MHIRITTLEDRPDDVVAQLQQQPGLVTACLLQPMDQPRSTVLLTAWDAAADADQATITAGGQDYADGRVDLTGNDGSPAYGQLVYFDGPRAQAQADAIDRANRDRIAPAVRAVPGNLAAYVGRAPDGSFAVLALATSLQAIEESQQAIMSTELLPGEDPALLTDPDRIQITRVLAHSSPTPVSS